MCMLLFLGTNASLKEQLTGSQFSLGWKKTADAPKSLSDYKNCYEIGVIANEQVTCACNLGEDLEWCEDSFVFQETDEDRKTTAGLYVQLGSLIEVAIAADANPKLCYVPEGDENASEDEYEHRYLLPALVCAGRLVFGHPKNTWPKLLFHLVDPMPQVQPSIGNSQ